MQKNAAALSEIIQNTAGKVGPQLEKLDEQMQKLKLEDLEAIGAQVRKMETNPLRQKVQQQMAEVQMTMASGYG